MNDNAKVGDVLRRVHTHIDKAQENINEEFSKDNTTKIFKKEDDYFICPNKFWDLWFQKLFAQVISVKLWIAALITILLGLGLITNVQFAAVLGTIMALKGTFQVASVFKKDPNVDESAMDKT
jgi:hypothetical protein